jgi:hypothetical protein
MNKKEENILEKCIVKLPPATYPGRIYGMYEWDWKESRWIINKEFCEEHNIKIKN